MKGCYDISLIFQRGNCKQIVTENTAMATADLSKNVTKCISCVTLSNNKIVMTTAVLLNKNMFRVNSS